MAAPKKNAKTQADRLNQNGIKASRVYSTVLLDPADLTLIRDPKHPLFDPRVNDPVDPTDPDYLSILAVGVHTPIKARENGERRGKAIVEVVDGRGRVQKLMHINKHHPLPTGPRKLKVELVRGSDGAMVLLALSSNTTKPETPFSRAVKIDMATKAGMGLEEIATACGWRTIQPVQAHLNVLNFIPAVQEAFHGQEALPLSAVAVFAKVPREEQLAALEKVRGGGAKKTREVEAAVHASQSGQEYVPPAPKKRMTWGRDKVEKLATAALAQVGTGWEETPAPNLELLAVNAILKHMLGDPDALKSHPNLQAAISRMDATL